MTNAVLQATAMSFGERALYAGRMVLIGMAAIFASLIILWAALALFRRFLERGNDVPSAPPTPVAPVVQPVAPVVSVPAASDDALIAAITAAVAATLAAENGGVVPAFRVVSFQRTQPRHSK